MIIVLKLFHYDVKYNQKLLQAVSFMEEIVVKVNIRVKSFESWFTLIKHGYVGNNGAAFLPI